MPIVGVYGVSVITAFLAALCASFLLSPKPTLIFKRNAIAAITLLLVSGGLLKAVEWTTPAGKAFNVALLQGKDVYKRQALQFKSIIRKLRAANPNLTFTSDFIVGFPGETEAEFEATAKLMQDVGFDYSFSFLYSPRPGTPASYLTDETPQSTKLARLAKLQALNEAQGKLISEAMLGTTQRVLIESASWKNASELAGKTDNNRIVDIVGDANLIGHVVNVRITDVSNPKRLRGEIING